MKKCTVGLFSKIITFLVFAVFFVPLTGISFYFAFLYPRTSQEERLIYSTCTVGFGSEGMKCLVFERFVDKKVIQPENRLS